MPVANSVQAMEHAIYRVLYQLTRAFFWTCFHLLGGFRAEGREHIPRQGPAVIAANHISNLDPPAISVAFPRGPYFMAKEELFDIPVLGKVIRVLHAFPVKRGAPDRAALRRAEEILRAGDMVVIFPEGRESDTGDLLDFQPGAALLALRAGVPVLPVRIQGTDLVMPYGTVKPRRAPRPTVVRIGPLLHLDDLAGLPDRRLALTEGTARIRAAVAALESPAPSTVNTPPANDR